MKTRRGREGKMKQRGTAVKLPTSISLRVGLQEVSDPSNPGQVCCYCHLIGALFQVPVFFCLLTGCLDRYYSLARGLTPDVFCCVQHRQVINCGVCGAHSSALCPCCSAVAAVASSMLPFHAEEAGCIPQPSDADGF